MEHSGRGDAASQGLLPLEKSNQPLPLEGPPAHIFTRWIFLSQFKVRNNIPIESDRANLEKRTDLPFSGRAGKEDKAGEKTGPFDATCQSQSWLAAFIATLEKSSSCRTYTEKITQPEPWVPTPS